MQRNVGGIDRTIRGVLGIWLVVVGVAAALDDQRIKAVTAIVAGIGLLLNWGTQFCGCNALFGIDTTGDESASE
ncbi:DUF2892 domain-containing protein [Natronorubrum sp. JWXQ-INN-674]|uniref:DUF2892 domain-containing protein n=1 Tax=Natronorubrum halalkaliphilum TaxID=2691917 RepID=A0A6B0VPE2_9EURY|nr:DUF2892 domain-containing protein [Natronorubrum halalkaliphilum]MXV63691.1 DUF2892 domain-containing protein [Natronorubrum halalkaliphilum]